MKNYMTNQTVYVLTSHREHEEYASNTYVIGVYTNLEGAQKVMLSEYENELKEWLKEYDEDCIEKAKYDKLATLFNTDNGIEYSRFEISERQVQVVE